MQDLKGLYAKSNARQVAVDNEILWNAWGPVFTKFPFWPPTILISTNTTFCYHSPYQASCNFVSLAVNYSALSYLDLSFKVQNIQFRQMKSVQQKVQTVVKYTKETVHTCIINLCWDITIYGLYLVVFEQLIRKKSASDQAVNFFINNRCNSGSKSWQSNFFDRQACTWNMSVR